MGGSAVRREGIAAGRKPPPISSEGRLSTMEAIGVALARPLGLTGDQRLTSLGDPIDGDDLLIDPMGIDEALDVVPEPTTKPRHLSAKERLTTVDALLMEIEDEVDALKRPQSVRAGRRKDSVTSIADGLSEEAIAKAWLDRSP